MSTPPVFHIGYHKTATSWMQQRLFMPAHGYRQLAGHAQVFEHIVQPHGLHFDAGAMQALIAKGMETLQSGEVPVISSEILSAHPFQGGHESDVYADRIKAIAPHARILITIRNQMKILPSVYMQYLLRGGTMPCDLFFEGTDVPGYFGFTPRHFEYDLLVTYYQQLFGTANVVVTTQEGLKADMEGWSRALADRLEASCYNGLTPEAHMVYAPSYPEYGVGLMRRMNHVQASTLNPTPIIKLGTTPHGLYRLAGAALRRPPLKSLLKDYRPVTRHVARTFAGYYTASNARLAALVPGLDLSGYP